MRISYQEIYDSLLRVLLKTGFAVDRAELCARLFAETSRDGIYSHGLNRFPRFMEMIRNGIIDIHARPQLIDTLRIALRPVSAKYQLQLG